MSGRHAHVIARMTDASDDRRDFFVSFNQADREWATWIAWVLNANGHGVFFQDWDFRGSFIEQMHQAILRSKKTLVVLSDGYLRSEYARSEAWAALARDPVGRQDRVVLMKVGPTGDLGLLAHFAYVDLTSAAEGEAEGLLLGRARMSLDPAYRRFPRSAHAFLAGVHRRGHRSRRPRQGRRSPFTIFHPPIRTSSVARSS